MDVKTGSPDSADFATTLLLIRPLWRFPQLFWGGRWHIGAITAWDARRLCLICNSQQILADFTMTRLLIYWHIAL
jgi:hypothetical protein